jgi:hypothetical protein
MLGLSFDNGIYIHNPTEPAGTATFYGTTYNSVITFIVNEYSSDTKLFSNMQLNSNDLLTGGGTLKLITISYLTDQGSDSATPPTDTRFRRREGSYDFPIRGFSSPSPLRGQYLICTMTFQNNGTNAVVSIHSVQTKFRPSRRW